MKLFKYYSLDDCLDQEAIYSILNSLQEDDKIEYEIVDGMGVEVFKIKDIGLTTSELKSLLQDFSRLEVIEYIMDDEDLDEDLDEDEYYDDIDDGYDSFDDY